MSDHRDPRSSMDPFDDPELAETARQVQAALETPPIDADFRRQLRGRVLAERARLIGSRERPWWRRLMEPPRSGTMRTLAPTLAVLLIACLVVAGLAVVPRLGRPGAAVAMTGSIQPRSEGSRAALLVHFSQPMDRSTVGAAVQIAPAASVSVGWRGQELVLTPKNGFAANVPYVLTVDGSRARTASGAELAGSPELSFGTAPAISSGPGLGAAGQPATAFAAAQLAGDTAAMRAQSAPGLSLPSLPSLSRVWVVSARPVSATTSRANVELLIDGSDGQPTKIASETLLIRADASGRLVVADVSVSRFQAMGEGPRIMHVGVAPGGRTVEVSYDCDMDTSSIAPANRATENGRLIPVSTSYDAATRTVTVRFPAWVHGTVELSVTRGLRDIDGRNLQVPFQTTVQVA